MRQVPEDLRGRLRAATPDEYPTVSIEAVLLEGRRVVRWHRVRAVLVATVVVTALAVGSTLLMVRRTGPIAAPAGSPRAIGHVSLSLAVGAADVERTFVVSVLPPEQGVQVVEYAEQTPTGLSTFARSRIDPSAPRVTWGYASGSLVLLGLLPSARATAVEIESSGGGGAGPEIRAIPGIDYAAFAYVTEKPLVGTSAVSRVGWFDEQGRPVDADGRVGAVAKLEGHEVWLTADGAMAGERDDLGNRTNSTPLAPTLTVFRSTTIDATHLGLWLGVIVPASAVSGAVQLVDGSQHPFTSTPLGSRRVFSVSERPYTGAVGVSSVRWVDASQVAHTLTP